MAPILRELSLLQESDLLKVNLSPNMLTLCFQVPIFFNLIEIH